MSKPLLKKKQVEPTPTPKKKLLSKARVSNSPATTPPVKHLVKKVAPPPAPRSGPIPVLPKGWKWKGKVDPRFKQEGYKLIDPANMPDTYPKLHDRVPPNTQWRVDPTGKRREALVTTMPDGVKVAWDTCSICTNHVSRCICKTGILHSQGVEWIYVTSLMRQDGLDLASPIDSTSVYVRERALHHYKGKVSATNTEAITRAVRNRGATKPRPTPAKPSEPRQARSGKPLLSKRKGVTPKSPQVDVSNVDLVNLSHDAASKADALVEQFDQMMNSGKPKRLLKKGKR